MASFTPLEVEAVADDEVDASGAPRRRWLFVALVVLLSGAVLGGFVLLGRDDADDVTAPTTTEPSSTSTPSPVERVLEAMPASPIDGKQSQKLPVLVTPREGLADGQPITALGKGFAPGERVGIVQCAAEAGINGVTSCDLSTVQYATASTDGEVQAPIAVRSSISTQDTGDVDCLSWAERCLVAIGALDDYDRSGGSMIAFAGAPAFTQPAAFLSSEGPFAQGEVVTVHAVDLLWPREVQVRLCDADSCAVLARGRVGPDGTFAADVALDPLVTAEGSGVPCDGGCALQIDHVGLPEATGAPMPAPLPVLFTGPIDPGPVPTPAMPEIPMASTPSSELPSSTEPTGSAPGTAIAPSTFPAAPAPPVTGDIAATTLPG